MTTTNASNSCGKRVPVISAEGLGVKAAVVRRIIAVDVPGLDQVGANVERDQMTDDAPDDPIAPGPLESPRGVSSFGFRFCRADEEFDVHREAMG